MSQVSIAEAQIEMDVLLAPIPGDSPTGVDLSSSTIYGEIEDLRITDEPIGTLGELKKGEARVADWGKVLTISSATMATRSKDLRLAYYIAQSLAKRHGLAGMRAGFQLFQRLHERFWPDMYPRIVDDDLEARTAWLEKLDKLFQETVAEVPVTHVQDEKPVKFWEWQGPQLLLERATKISKPEEKKIAIQAATERKNELDKSVGKTSPSFYEDLHHEITLCFEACKQLCRVVEENLAAEPGAKQLEERPNFYYTRQALGEILAIVESILERKGLSPVGKSETTAAQGQPAVSEKAKSPALPGEELTREGAINGLTAIASFFLRTEPHSPVGYLVERAIRWSRLSLTELLEEMLQDTAVMAKVKNTLGISGQ